MALKLFISAALLSAFVVGRGWMARSAGILAFYITALVTGSFYVKKWIGQRLWRGLHYFSFVSWGMVTLHGLLAGSDSRTVLMLTIYALATLSTAVLTFYRLLAVKPKPGARLPRPAQG